MRALVQRVTAARVEVDGNVTGAIGRGLLVFLGVRASDTEREAEELARKSASLRIFEDPGGKMNLSVADTGGEILVVSQFTLYGDTRRGHRPSFTDAADPGRAESLYEHYVAELKRRIGEGRVMCGVFRAMMKVHLVNDGPVTLMLETDHTP